MKKQELLSWTLAILIGLRSQSLGISGLYPQMCQEAVKQVSQEDSENKKVKISFRFLEYLNQELK